jgi:hypothetical protein
VIGADISDSGIIGFDFLKAHGCVLDLGQRSFKFMGVEIPSVDTEDKDEDNLIAQVKEDTEIPAKSEMILEVEMNNHNLTKKFMILEPKENFEEKYCLKMAAILVDTEQPKFVRILNPQDTPVRIFQGTKVATAQVAEKVLDIALEEEEENMLSNTYVRSIGDVIPAQLNNDTKLSANGNEELPENLQDLYERSIKGLTAEESSIVKKLLNQHAAAFQKNSEDLGQLKPEFGEHVIPTGDAIPIKQAPRRTPLAFKGAEEEEIAKMLRMDVIRPSTSPWASPVVLVRKKDGSIRYCIDYTKLNRVVSTISYPLPRIDDCIDSLNGAISFSSMDLACGYWQIPVKESDKHKTAFTTKSGLFEFNKMPFGITNAPSSFERCMEMVLRNCQWKTCLVYLDDIIVFGKSFEEHVQRLGQVLDRLIHAGLKLKPSKCHFFKEQLVFLGHMITKNGVTTDPTKIEALSKWPRPKSLKDVRSFLGFCSYYRRYVQNFADISEPLASLTRKENKFEWTSKTESSFQALKEALISAPMLAYPKDEGIFILDTDGSNTGIGGVLSQIQHSNLSEFANRTLTDLEKKYKGEEKVISFGSKILTKEERNYCVTRKELLAVVYFLKQYRHYLLGRQFIVRTDHHALKWIFQLKDPTGQIARWQERLTDYNFEIIHRPGKKHGNADGLSRRPEDENTAESVVPCGPCKKCLKQELPAEEVVNAVQTRQSTAKANAAPPTPMENCDENSWMPSYTNSQMQLMQSEDPDISPIFKAKTDGNVRMSANFMTDKSPAM